MTSDYEIVRQTLRNCELNLGRLGNGQARSLTDPDLWNKAVTAADPQLGVKVRRSYQPGTVGTYTEIPGSTNRSNTSIWSFADDHDTSHRSESVPKCACTPDLQVLSSD